jgi:hypothetical protein
MCSRHPPLFFFFFSSFSCSSCFIHFTNLLLWLKKKKNLTFLSQPFVSFFFILFLLSSLIIQFYLLCLLLYHYCITNFLNFEYYIQISLSKLFLKILIVESLYHCGLCVWSNYKLYTFLFRVLEKNFWRLSRIFFSY